MTDQGKLVYGPTSYMSLCIRKKMISSKYFTLKEQISNGRISDTLYLGRGLSESGKIP